MINDLWQAAWKDTRQLKRRGVSTRQGKEARLRRLAGSLSSLSRYQARPCHHLRSDVMDRYCPNCGPVKHTHAANLVDSACDVCSAIVLHSVPVHVTAMQGRIAELEEFAKTDKAILLARARKLEQQAAEIQKLKTALNFICEWKLPRVQTGSGECSYGVAYGSSGERDYMIAVAKKALTAVEE